MALPGWSPGRSSKQPAIDDVRIIEKGGDFGGTWYWNRYPGAQCDTASFIYLPLLEETGHMPSEKYTHAPEIAEHCRRIGEHFDLYDNAVFSTEVTGVEWDDDAERWTIHTNRGDAMRAKYLAMGTGPLHRPKLPGIPGLERFEGHSFHTSRWDYEYTGGDPSDPSMPALGDKRVGIIGTGATAVQCVPHLARAAGELYVFQRTPSSIDVRNNRPTDPEWFATLEPGMAEAMDGELHHTPDGRFRRRRPRDGRLDRHLGADPRQAAVVARARPLTRGDAGRLPRQRRREDGRDPRSRRCDRRGSGRRPMRSSRGIDSSASDPASTTSTSMRSTRRTPTSSTPTVTGSTRSPNPGVIVDGVEYELDCIIYASGFEVGTEFTRRWGYDVCGRNGEMLSEHWADGMMSLHGIHVHGFPNMFIVSPTQAANLISNIPHNLTEAGETIATVIAHANDVDADQIEVTADAEAAWVAKLEAGGRTFGGDPTCTPGYYNNEGKGADEKATRNSLGYPDGPVAYFEYIDRWRDSGEFDGLEFR